MTEIEGVVPALGKALAKRGYEALTPVQQAVLGAEMEGADALVSAQTGSGKTVAFGLAMAPTLLDEDGRFGRLEAPVALAVAPTRELAMQVQRELEWLYEFTGASVTSCVGGMDPRRERWALERGAHIVVGTPGRLRDHIERGALDLSQMKVVVLDEADEMLHLGFREDLEFILGAAPEERRTLMFSATVAKPIVTLAQRYQRDAVRITTAGEKRQHGDIEYRALLCAPSDRENAIINVLRHTDAPSAIVFCSTRATVAHLTSRFTNRGIPVVALSGELNQSARTYALQALRDGRAKVCVATDVAARGIDLPNLELVIHADLPKNQESLLHRSGRTGRAGRKGVSTLIVPYSMRRKTERLLGFANVTATWGKPPSADEILALDRKRILEDPDLGGETTEEERAFATELLAKHDAEAVAIAFLRKQMAGLAAPEDLIDGPSDDKRRESPRKTRQDFENGVWLRLSVGRSHRAEARWILPMLIRTGNITKADVGRIKIQENETYVEMLPAAAESFLEAVGPSRKVEKSITVDRFAGGPEMLEDIVEQRAPRKPRADRRSRQDQETGDRAPVRKWDKGRKQDQSERGRATARPDAVATEVPDLDGKPRKFDKNKKSKGSGGKPGGKFAKGNAGNPKHGDGNRGEGKRGAGKPKKTHRKGQSKPKASWVD
ncbi:DEAD/DEAH box helicase [Nisaea acidiphila]|uniref:DEAD/DEAH box helicase n=1 Tax=Nisaea acidiphila TaxID=1862145 RepID=A0A9J7AQ28_9PROT|nr:DEAD/DEAH box helicase [Nisaea acidiphila]UUX49270.1 DEAD/DEAH box helicase [Nisaea acidiphila]